MSFAFKREFIIQAFSEIGTQADFKAAIDSIKRFWVILPEMTQADKTFSANRIADDASLIHFIRMRCKDIFIIKPLLDSTLFRGKFQRLIF